LLAVFWTEKPLNSQSLPCLPYENFSKLNSLLVVLVRFAVIELYVEVVLLVLASLVCLVLCGREEYA